MRAWLAEHPNGLKSKFETYWKEVPPADKVMFGEQAKAAVSSIPHYLRHKANGSLKKKIAKASK
ncbi:hypothetical protein DXG01_000463 [Tephrocybe rancida]|nr:hypothetical protein DXG01_000463 [Tephrocybe rancida]